MLTRPFSSWEGLVVCNPQSKNRLLQTAFQVSRRILVAKCFLAPPSYLTVENCIIGGLLTLKYLQESQEP